MRGAALMVSMSTISTAAETARETARTATGQFGTQTNTAPTSGLVPQEALGSVTRKDVAAQKLDAAYGELNKVRDKVIEAEKADLAARVHDLHPEGRSVVLEWEDDSDFSGLRLRGIQDADGNDLATVDEIEDAVDNGHFDIYQLRMFDDYYSASRNLERATPEDGMTFVVNIGEPKPVTEFEVSHAEAEGRIVDQTDGNKVTRAMLSTLLDRAEHDDDIMLQRLANLDAADIEHVYDSIIGPATDRLEDFFRG